MATRRVRRLSPFEARPAEEAGRAPQRLLSLSSGLPLPFVPRHGVENGEDLAGDGDESDHFRLTGSEQALIEGAQYRIAATGGKRSQEDGRAGGGTAAGDHAVAFPLAGPSGERRDTDQACDLATGQSTELGDICQEGAGERIADTWERDQQILLLSPHRRAAHYGVDVAVDLRQLFLERGDVASEALANATGTGTLLTLAFGDQHLDELGAPAHQFGQQPRRLVRQFPRFRLHRLGEVGDHARVDRVGLRALADRLRKVTNLRSEERR